MSVVFTKNLVQPVVGSRQKWSHGRDARTDKRRRRQGIQGPGAWYLRWPVFSYLFLCFCAFLFRIHQFSTFDFEIVIREYGKVHMQWHLSRAIVDVWIRYYIFWWTEFAIGSSSFIYIFIKFSYLIHIMIKFIILSHSRCRRFCILFATFLCIAATACVYGRRRCDGPRWSAVAVHVVMPSSVRMDDADLCRHTWSRRLRASADQCRRRQGCQRHGACHLMSRSPSDHSSLSWVELIFWSNSI